MSAVNYCIREEKGSKKPLLNVLKQLEEEEAIVCVKRGKSHLCTIVEENLLVSIPYALEQIRTKFVEFANEFKEVEGKKLYTACNYSYSGLKAMEDIKVEKRIQILPYEVLEVTKELYSIFFESILSGKIESEKHINLLYGIYRKKKVEMESFLCQNFPINSDLTSSLEKRKHDPPLGKLCNIVDICRYIRIEKQLYDFLGLLWSSNIETCVLLYGLTKEKIPEENIQKKEVIEYTVFDIINEMHSRVNGLIDAKEVK
jgi:hypothetical protein